MFTDTHCHINMLVKDTFDTPLTTAQYIQAQQIIKQAAQHNVTTLINVGTSLVESENCVQLAQEPGCFAAIGIHPNDCTPQWSHDLKIMRNKWCWSKDQLHDLRIIAIGEVGLDYHYADFNKQRQHDAFRAQIELALEYDLALIIHTRDAAEDTLAILDMYRNESLRGIIHCFSQNNHFAHYAINHGFVLGIGGPITYPKNNELRTIFAHIPANKIVLETDAPFLPIQAMRGKKNDPKFIPLIAQYIAEMRNESLDSLASTIAITTQQLFRLNDYNR